MADEWSGLYCRHCGYEASKKVAARGKGYCLDCGRRLGSLDGQRNPWPIRHKQAGPGVVAPVVITEHPKQPEAHILLDGRHRLEALKRRYQQEQEEADRAR